jgi:pyrophosphate--fructose-6-phosphate 1-phosphotransferase
MNRPISPLQRARIDFAAKLPAVFTEHGAHVAADVAATVPLVADQKGIPEQFPHTGGLPFVAFRGGDTTDRSALNVAVILSGGQAPGGHNVIAGLFDGLK